MVVQLRKYTKITELYTLTFFFFKDAEKKKKGNGIGTCQNIQICGGS